MNLIGNGIIEITFHGRGGQTAVTASQLLAELAFEKGFKDVISIPLIGAERRGSPVMSFTKISEDKEIKTYAVFGLCHTPTPKGVGLL